MRPADSEPRHANKHHGRTVEVDSADVVEHLARLRELLPAMAATQPCPIDARASTIAGLRRVRRIAPAPRQTRL